MKANKYDYLMIIIISSISLGMYFQLIKYIGIIGFPYAFGKLLKSQNRILYFFICLLLYFIVIMPFTQNLFLCLDDFLAFLSLLGSFMLLIQFSTKACNPCNSIIVGWTFAFLMTVPYAFYEYITGMHHYTSLIEDNLNIDRKRYVSVFFGNMNRYSLFLCCCIPFIFSRLLVSSNRMSRFINIFVLLLLLFFVINNASRGAIIVLSISLIVLLINIKHNLNVKMVLIIAILLFVFYNFYSDALLQFQSRLEAKSGFYDLSRNNIYMACFLILLDNYGMGMGFGNMPFFFEKYSYLVHHIRIPHNLFLEIILVSGIPFFVIFFKWLIDIYIKGCKLVNQSMRLIYIISSLTILPLSVINSNYVLNPIMWLYFASLYIIIDKYENKRFVR